MTGSEDQYQDWTREQLLNLVQDLDELQERRRQRWYNKLFRVLRQIRRPLGDLLLVAALIRFIVFGL